jgi:hypothetical protein
VYYNKNCVHFISPGDNQQQGSIRVIRENPRLQFVVLRRSAAIRGSLATAQSDFAHPHHRTSSLDSGYVVRDVLP